MRPFVILDERHVWHEAACEAAQRYGFAPQRITSASRLPLLPPGGVGFIRPHAQPNALERNHHDYVSMERAGLMMIQDPNQMAVYESKRTQWQFWGKWMPRTWVFVRKQDALEFIESGNAPEIIVSKADEGASSVNVRILNGRDEQRRHVVQVFDHGIRVDCCADGAHVVQNDYVLLQEFIPHRVTWRVNIVGDGLAGFMRYCYPDKAVAQTGNTAPIMEMTDEVESLFHFSRRFFAEAETNWCAIDVLKDGDQWRLLETSLAWPWPGVGKAAPFFGTDFTWPQMFDMMFDAYERGVWV